MVGLCGSDGVDVLFMPAMEASPPPSIPSSFFSFGLLPLRSGDRHACAILLLALTGFATAAQPAGPALVRHGVVLNGAATIEGSETTIPRPFA